MLGMSKGPHVVSPALKRMVMLAAPSLIAIDGDKVTHCNPFVRKKNWESVRFTGSTMRVTGVGEDTSRVTMTRMVAIGIFAFAAKKKTSKREVIVEIDGADGGHLLLTFPSKQEAAWKRIEITWNREANSQAVA